MAIDSALQQALSGGHLPLSTNKIRLSTPDGAMLFPNTQQPTGGHRLVGTLNAEHLRFT